jgi:hypothetical protein
MSRLEMTGGCIDRFALLSSLDLSLQGTVFRFEDLNTCAKFRDVSLHFRLIEFEFENAHVGVVKGIGGIGVVHPVLACDEEMARVMRKELHLPTHSAIQKG